jgi:hypothetical protein
MTNVGHFVSRWKRRKIAYMWRTHGSPHLLLIRFGIPHLYVSFAGYLCYAYRSRGSKVWSTGVLYSRHRVWRER